jgi:hypothetical protein
VIGQHRHTPVRQGNHGQPGRSHNITYRPTDAHIRTICTPAAPPFQQVNRP